MLLTSLLLASPARISANAVLDGPESAQLMRHISDLLEATRIVMPELSRAGAPLQENFRQGVNTLETSPSRNHAGVLYRMLINAKAYLQLSDTLPKPADFSEDVEQAADRPQGGDPTPRSPLPGPRSTPASSRFSGQTGTTSGGMRRTTAGSGPSRVPTRG